MNEFSDYICNKKVALVCKGDTNNTELSGYDIYIGIKQSLILCPTKDVLVTYHLEGLFGLEEYICNIKFLIVPQYLSVGSYDIKKFITHDQLYEYLKMYNFKGKIIILKRRGDRNSAWLALRALQECAYPHDLDIYGYYNSNKVDNKIITAINNATVIDKYKSIYLDYKHRTNNCEMDRLTKNWQRSFKNKKEFIYTITILRNETHKLFNNLKINFVSCVVYAA